MRIGCGHGEVRDHRNQVFIPPCGEPAIMVILHAAFDDTRGECETCGYDSEPTYVGYCEQHAPEAVHEARSSMADDEFLVITPPAFPEKVPS